MKKILKSLIICLILCVFMSGVILNPHLVSAEEGPCEIVMDADSGRVLYALNECKKMRVASLTKILTCITALKFCDVNKSVKIQPEWAGVEGSSAYLKADEEYTVSELLYGMMLRSGNDCALSVASGGGLKYAAFIAAMNETAKEAGAVLSNFVNPHGLDAPGHFSTAYDLALITRLALSDERFSEIVACKSHKIGTGDYERTIYNKNKMLKNYEFATGVKTGYTKKAGRCLVTSAEKNGFKLISVVLNCPPMYERSKQLLENAYNEYDNVLLAQKDVACAFFKRKDGALLPCYVSDDVFYPLKKDEMRLVESEVVFNDDEKMSGDFRGEIGTIKFYLKKQLIFEKKIYNIVE